MENILKPVQMAIHRPQKTLWVIKHVIHVALSAYWCGTAQKRSSNFRLPSRWLLRGPPRPSPRRPRPSPGVVSRVVGSYKFAFWQCQKSTCYTPTQCSFLVEPARICVSPGFLVLGLVLVLVLVAVPVAVLVLVLVLSTSTGTSTGTCTGTSTSASTNT